MAVSALVLGLVGIFCLGPLTGLPAVILGHIAYGRARKQPDIHGGEGLALAGLILGYVSFIIGIIFVSIMAGMTLPALSQAKDKAMRIKCVNNLKMISLSARIYATDHDDRFPPSFLAMGQELTDPRVLICPADSQKRPLEGTNWTRLGPQNITYEFLTPGALESDVATRNAFRCPIHDNVALGDGTVQLGLPGRRGGGGGGGR